MPPTTWTTALLPQTDLALASIGYVPPTTAANESPAHRVIALYRNGTLVACAEVHMYAGRADLGDITVAPNVKTAIRWEVFTRALKGIVVLLVNAGCTDGYAWVKALRTDVRDWLQSQFGLVPTVIATENGLPALWEYHVDNAAFLAQLNARYP